LARLGIALALAFGRLLLVARGPVVIAFDRSIPRIVFDSHL
jgi:hypothetical protein